MTLEQAREAYLSNQFEREWVYKSETLEFILRQYGDLFEDTVLGAAQVSDIECICEVYVRALDEAGISPEQGFYSISNWTDLISVDFHVARRFVHCFVPFHISRNKRIWVIFGAGKFAKIAIRMFSGLDSTPLAVEDNRERAWSKLVKMMRKKNVNQKATGSPSSSLSDYVTSLLTFVGELSMTNPTNVDQLLPKEHPMSSAYEAISRYYLHRSSLIEERSRKEDLLYRENDWESVRRLLWKMTMDTSMAPEQLIENVMTIIGERLHFSRCLFRKASLDNYRESDLVVVQEWMRPGLTSMLGHRISSGVFDYLPLKQPMILTPKSCKNLFPARIARQMIGDLSNQENFIGFLLPVWINNEFYGLFTIFDDESGSGNADRIKPYEILDEIVCMVEQGITQYLADSELLKTKAELEAMILQRTRNMEMANQALKMARERAEVANQAKSDFLARISHDLRTPLTVILGLSELINQADNIKFQRDQANVILVESRRMKEMINELLNLSKIEHGTVSVESIEFSLQELFLMLVSAWRVAADEKQIYFKTFIQPDIPQKLIGDSKKLHNILVNLISNAVKFTHQGGVTLTAEIIPSTDSLCWIHFDVIDTGIGIANEHLSRIFEKYEQADVSIYSQYGGSGLGTSIAHQLTQLMGGSIGVVSQEQQGSRFWIRLPFALPEEAQCRTTSPVELPRFKGQRVLIVDDYPGTRSLMEQLLTSYNLEVETVENGQVAVSVLTQRRFDLVFMDLQMPVMDGFLATHSIRHQLKLTDLPIFAMSANVYEKDKVLNEESGMNGFLAKPIEQAELMAVLYFYFSQGAETYA